MASSIGGYELERELGRGATGVVYRARSRDGVVVALKVLAPVLAEDRVFRQRFEREAETMRRLDDAHCVTVRDFGTDELPWIAMEYVHGATLRAVLAQAGVLTPAQACGVLVGALGGLGRAHELGLIHRDVKPENVLVDAVGVSKLADFGLVADRADLAGWRPIEGTPSYMSPEQIRGLPLDQRSDLYAAGAMLFELLTGRPPYQAEAPIAVLHAHVSDPPPPLDGVPEHVGAVIRKALAKQPDDRPASAGEFAAALEGAADRDLGPGWLAASGIAGIVAGVIGAQSADESASPAARSSSRRRSRALLATGIAAALVTATIGIAIASTSDDTAHRTNPKASTTGSSVPKATVPPATVAGPVDPCLIGRWHTVTATSYYRETSSGRVDSTSGGNGIVRTIAADGTERYDWNASAPFTGVASGGPLTMTFRGIQTGTVTARDGAESDTAPSNVSISLAVNIGGSPIPNTVVYPGSTTAIYACTPTGWGEHSADGTSATWTKG